MRHALARARDEAEAEGAPGPQGARALVQGLDQEVARVLAAAAAPPAPDSVEQGGIEQDGPVD